MTTKKFLFLSVLFILSIKIMAQNANWTPILPAQFPTNVSGQIHGISRVSQMKFHATNPNKMYAVSARGGVFVSTDAGANWVITPGTDFMAYSRLASICVDHSNDQILYVGTGDHNYYYSGNGVLKSTNGGFTYTNVGLAGKLVCDIIMHPTDVNSLVAITNTGIYKSANAGGTWVLKTASRPFDDIKQKTPTSSTLYAATADSAFFRSNDFGETWNQITTGIVLPAGVTDGQGCRLATSAADTNVVYLGMVANGGLIYKSTNGGTSFTAIKTAASPYLTYYDNSSTSSGQGDYNFGLGCDRNNANIVYLVAHNNWKSIDGGTTWTQLTNWWEKCHTDMHQIVTNPYDNTKLYNVNDGGIFLSTDGGNNWTPRSNGIYGYEIYHGNCSPTRKDMISIGTQDNGELYSTTAGWFTNRGGDWGSQCAFDYRPNSAMVYYYESNKRRLVTGGESTYGLPAQVTLLHDIAFHRSNTNLAFVADTFIYRTTNLLNSTPAWTQIANLNQKIMAMHVSFGDANKLYIITGNGKIHVSNNALAATPTFTEYSLPITSVSKASITSIKTNTNVIYITANTGVYKSTDNGATWTTIKYNLPSVNHVKILADEYYSSTELVFVASNNTVYYKIGNATTWTIYNTNLPTRTEVVDMSIFNDSTGNTALRYSSYGRGMWETPISNLRLTAANFSVSDVNPCIGAPITFNDISTGNVTSRTWSFPGGTPASSTSLNPVVTYASAGNFSVSLTVSNGSTTDTKTLNNYVSTFAASLPFAEGFEGADDPPLGWKNKDLGVAGVAWAKSFSSGGFANSASSMIFDNYSFNNSGEKDELWSKGVDLTTATGAKLFFDVAYQVYSGYSDTLTVLVSTDCGNTFTQLYQKGGTVLSSAGSGSNNFVPTAAQWRTDTVNLTAYIGQPNVIVAFQNTNGYGNKLYLDNVNIINVTGCTTPLVGGSISGNVNMNSGTVSNFTLTGNTGNVIQWQTSNNGGTSWTNVAGGNSATAGVTLTGGTYLLRAVSSSNTTNCAEAYSNVLTLNVASLIGDVFSNPIIVTSLPFSTTVSNASGFTNAYTGANAQSSPDIFYRITTNACADTISVSTCGSAFDTYLHLLNSAGTQIAVNDDNGVLCTGNAASLKAAITPNTVYYVVVEGYSTNTGTINLNINQIDNPVQTVSISAASSTTLCQGEQVVLSSSQASGNVWNTNEVTQDITVSTAGNYSLTYTNPSGCVSTSNTIGVVVNTCQITFNLKALIQGYYDNNGMMKAVLMNQNASSNPSLTDEIIVELHQANSPYSLMHSFVGNLNTTGNLACIFPASVIGNEFYIVFKHRNSITTWSSSPIIMLNNVTYDFTNAITKAYGSNLVEMDNGIFAVYNGDINLDGSISSSDYTVWETDANAFSSGYLSSDIDGNGGVDSPDFSVWETNANLFVGAIEP